VAKFGLLFDAIDSDVSNFLFIIITGPKVAQCIQVVSVLLHETILPSFERNWLKWSCDKYNIRRQLVGAYEFMFGV